MKEQKCGFEPEGCKNLATTELLWQMDTEEFGGSFRFRIPSVSLFVCNNHIIEGCTKSGSIPPVMPLIIPIGE